MEPKVLLEILQNHVECSREGDSVLRVPEVTEVMVFASAGRESLVIDRARDFLLSEWFVVISTARGERYFLPYPELRCLRVSGGSSRLPGYAKG